MTTLIHCVLTNTYLLLSLFRHKKKILVKQKTRSASHTTLRSGILIGSVIVEQWCMPKNMIEKLSKTVLMGSIPAHFHHAISVPARNKENCKDFPCCDHPPHIPVAHRTLGISCQGRGSVSSSVHDTQGCIWDYLDQNHDVLQGTLKRCPPPPTPPRSTSRSSRWLKNHRLLEVNWTVKFLSQSWCIPFSMVLFPLLCLNFVLLFTIANYSRQCISMASSRCANPLSSGLSISLLTLHTVVPRTLHSQPNAKGHCCLLVSNL